MRATVQLPGLLLCYFCRFHLAWKFYCEGGFLRTFVFATLFLFEATGAMSIPKALTTLVMREIGVNYTVDYR